MRELDSIRHALAIAHARGDATMLVTVLHVEGSVYRGAGARMVVSGDSSSTGAVSGGCLEADIIARAPEVIAAGQPQLVQYDTRVSDSDVLGLGMGCQGVIDLLLEPLAGEALQSALSFYERLAKHREPVELLTACRPATADAPAVATRLVRNLAGKPLEGDERIAHMSAGSVAREIVRPAVQLVICGGGTDAIPLARLARLMGWHITVIDHRPSFASASRFPEADAVIHAHVADDVTSLDGRITLDANTAAVVMAHSAAHDRAYLHRMLDAGAGYIGVLGPRRRTTELLGPRVEGGALPDSVHSPVGLDIGAETPDEIALAVVSEISAVSAGRHGGMLRNRGGPIHEREG